MNTNLDIEQARLAFQQGEKVRARELLAGLVQREPNNGQAWLLLADVLDDPKQATYCRERARKIIGSAQPVTPSTATPQARSSPPSPIVAPEATPKPALPVQPVASLPPSEPLSSVQYAAKAKADAQVVQQVSARTGTVRTGKSPQSWLLIFAVSVIVIVCGAFVVGGLFVLGPILSRQSVTVVPTGIVQSASIATATSMFPPTYTPSPVSVSCQSEALRYSQQIKPSLDRFNDKLAVAKSTPRVALGSVIGDLQAIRREVGGVPAPDCVQSASDLLLSGMDSTIKAHIDFLGSVEDVVVERELGQGLLDTGNGLAQLLALMKGEPTPIAQKLPTSTPLPTLAPTATPLPAGSSIMVENWQVQVERIVIADKLSSKYSDKTEKPAGRFALLFLSVTNRSLSPESFGGFGLFLVQDAEGKKYEMNIMATAYAQDQYGTDYGVDINPDATNHVMVVFDISKQSDYYVLVPGILAKSGFNNVLLKIP